MPTRNYLTRLEQAEKAVKAQSKFSRDCICFPEGEPPCFHWNVEQEIASRVKCPLHGDRFPPQFLVYASTWFRKKREWFVRERSSAQFQKAWVASFPRELWPGEEEETAEGTIYLKLKDGTRVLAYVPAYSKWSGRPDNRSSKRIG